MSEEKEQQDKLQDFQFIQYIAMLANTGMQHLGKMMNPITGKTERNLDAARAIIDILSMFKEKTKGNLTKEESRVMDEALSNLQLNYADEVERAAGPSPSREVPSEARGAERGAGSSQSLAERGAGSSQSLAERGAGSSQSLAERGEKTHEEKKPKEREETKEKPPEKSKEEK